MSATNPKIEIELEGGLVAAVRTTHDVGEVDYMVVDYDCEGADDERVTEDRDGREFTVDGGTSEVAPFASDSSNC